MIKVGFFGRLADRIGREVELDFGDAGSVAELRTRLASLFPDAADELTAPSVRAFVGDAIVSDGHIIGAGDHVEFFPALSGG
jgi:molybdopterin converting factor small subunit